MLAKSKNYARRTSFRDVVMDFRNQDIVKI